MRKTLKYTEGQKLARILKVNSRLTHEALYKQLEAQRYFWNSKAKVWEPGKPQTSMFAEGDDDSPSGVVRLRVMAHPAEIEKAVAAAKSTKGMRCIETSGEYPNRRGVGVRVYLTFVMDSK